MEEWIVGRYRCPLEADLTYRGHVKNGQIKLDEPARLPEGARVNVDVVEESESESGPRRREQARRF